MSFCLPNIAAIKLVGSSAIDFGHRLFSRNIQALKISEGKLSVFLSAEGKVQEIFWVVRREEGLLLLTAAERASSLKELIEKYHFAEPFRLEDVLQVTGSWAPSSSSGGIGKLVDSKFGGLWRGTKFIFDLGGTNSKQPTSDAWEVHRIQNLIPEYGKDFNSSTLLFDLGFEELCDPGKGCYIGQEVVERVRTRGGNLPRKLALFKWSGEVTANAAVTNERGESVGALTSSQAATNDAVYSLGFAKRGACKAGDKVFAGDAARLGEVVKIGEFGFASDKNG